MPSLPNGESGTAPHLRPILNIRTFTSGKDAEGQPHLLTYLLTYLLNTM